MSDQEVYGFGPYSVTEISHFTICLSDETRLSAKLWIPDFRRDSSKCFAEQFSDFNFNTYDVHLIGKNNQADRILDPDETFPTILEYLPYHKDIFTSTRDHNRHPWFSSHGFVVMRAELRGTGVSGGFYHGEYLAREQEDCREILEFIARQSWSNGRVGMYGKSWGGLNGLQMAYFEPEESPLKTVISLYSTDDRYTDDFHHEGGTPIGAGLASWSAHMLVKNSYPPSPRCFSSREDWLEAWTQRLKESTLSLTSSLTHHQMPGPFWDHGSIAVDYDRVKIPVFVIGGLEDPYKTAIERMARKLNDESKFLIGPWVHDWPDVSLTGPNIEFLTLCLEWFSEHLKVNVIDPEYDTASDISDEKSCRYWPRLQLFVRDSFKPPELYSPPQDSGRELGRFVAFSDWLNTGTEIENSMNQIIHHVEGASGTHQNISTLYFERNFLNENKLSFKPYKHNLKATPVHLPSHALQGVNCGSWFHVGDEIGYPGDQATSISHSVSFISETIVEPLVMIGSSTCILRVSASSWKRVYISVKVSDLHEDGTATLITRCQYDLNYLKPVREDDRSKTFALPMHFTSHCFQPHNKVVISVSPNAFPMMWPSNTHADVYIYPEDCRFLYQTERLDNIYKNTIIFPQPRPLLPIAKMELSAPKSSYLVSKLGDKVNFVYLTDSGLQHVLHTANLKHRSEVRESYLTDEAVTDANVTIDQKHSIVFDSLTFVDDDECTELGIKIMTHHTWAGSQDSYRWDEELVITWFDTEEVIFSKSWSDVVPRMDHRSW